MINIFNFYLKENLELSGEGEYNLKDLKTVEVTESYMGMPEDIRKCQNKEPYENCTTRLFITTLMETCGCLPFNIRLSDQVKNHVNL